jgi:putative hemin transport protein
MDGIVDAWVVRKPTEDGMVTAIECFNKDEDQVVQFFGKRKPGIPELESWREIVSEVESEHKLS